MTATARDGGAGVVAGIDIGGTTTQVLLCSPELTVLARAEVPTPAAEGGRAMVGAALAALHGLLARTPHRPAGVGIGAAGIVDSHTGHILVASDSFRGWAGYAVTDAIEAALGIPAFLDNDVNAFLRGEASPRGAIAGESHALGITLGTGVGGALWIDGEVYDGPHGAAGEIGHIPGFGDLPCSCGGRGHLETLAAGRAIAARYRERADPAAGPTTARDVLLAADDGDQDARAVFRTAGTAIARAILITAGLIDVTTVVIGGGVSRAWSHLEPAIRTALTDEPPVSGRPVHLVRASLGDDAVALGAAARARSELNASAGPAVPDCPSGVGARGRLSA
ncbi:ROK family protein [Streptomyces sp. NPDC051322]|uniref:ROK family protein n=1 Tax=Streptomyces sp. NPDC051322 TaxID=3154645 RepID=UPI00344CE24C